MIVETTTAAAIMWGLAHIARSIPAIIWALRCPADSPAYRFPDSFRRGYIPPIRKSRDEVSAPGTDMR